VSADFSEDRRRRVIRHLRRKRAELGTLSDRARLLYAVSLLLADGHGHVGKAAMVAALEDPSTVQVARTLLDEAVRT
jgi:hypothetical protein